MVTLTVLMGPPGCGKTTWMNDHGTGMVRCSTERLRTDPEFRERQSATAAFLAKLQRKAETALSRGRDVVIDACNTRAHERARWIGVAHRHSAHAGLVVFHVPLSTLIAVQHARTYGVSDDKMYGYQRTFTNALNVIGNEQWGSITHIHRDNEQGDGIKHKSISNW